MGNLISKSAFSERFKHWKYLMFSFCVVWKLNFLRRIHRHFLIKLIPKLGFKTSLGTYDSFNDFMRVNKSDVANSKKMFISSGKKCNMLSKFWMAPSVHNFDKFLSEKNMFFTWPGGGFPLFVCGITQKKSVDLGFHGMASSLLYFLQSPKWTVSFFLCLFSLHNSCFGVFVNPVNLSKMNPVISMIFHTNTITYTDT